MSHVFLRVTLPALKLEFNFENRHLKKKTILEFGLFKMRIRIKNLIC